MRLLCLACGAETLADGEQPCCPECKDNDHVPADLDDTVDLTITRHELRILTFWADNWARQHDEFCQKAMQIILDRIGMQTNTALTLGHEIADLVEQFGDVRVFRPGTSPPEGM